MSCKEASGHRKAFRRAKSIEVSIPAVRDTASDRQCSWGKAASSSFLAIRISTIPTKVSDVLVCVIQTSCLAGLHNECGLVITAK